MGFNLKAAINWMVECYYQVKEEKEALFHLENVLYDKNGQLKLKVRMKKSGGQIGYSTPEKIVTADTILERFPKSHIKLITSLAFSNKYEPKYRIANVTRQDDDGVLISIENIHSKKIYNKTPQQLSSDIDVLCQLSARDIHKIGFYSGLNSGTTQNPEKSLVFEPDFIIESKVKTQNSRKALAARYKKNTLRISKAKELYRAGVESGLFRNPHQAADVLVSEIRLYSKEIGVKPLKPGSEQKTIYGWLTEN